MSQPNDEGLEITILDFAKVPSADPRRRGRLDYMYTISLPNGRIRIVTIPVEEIESLDEKAKEEKIKEYIRKDLEEYRKWVGKKIKI
ncbi:MAG: hypothetical protein DRI61_01355 [Chloroflexi bacterium]|nr:MAG: hypothetical protein DRI61_01355 [Chloroflexota bacterium]